jgi:two-component system chemotaxis sensor kinase CheA
LPVIALSTLASEEEMAHGYAVGLNDYQVKLDQEQLLECIGKALQGSDIRGR